MDTIQKVHLTEFETGGYPVYRIPGIVTSSSGAILCYFETRLEASDWSTRNIGMRRSTDGGRTWSAIRELVQNEEATAVNNPVMIASRSGRIHFLWQKDYRRSFYCYSDDDGLTFSAPTEITPVFEAYRSEYPWSLYALGPGHGIELKDGRLLVPVWICQGEGNAHTPTVVSVIQSRDGGQNWERGEIVYATQEMITPNETTAVQLKNGSIMLNMRHGGKRLYRAVTVSQNGLSGYSVPRLDENLPDPMCCGSILKISGQDENNLLFLNCNFEAQPGIHPNNRNHLTLRYSLNEGKTWAFQKEIELLGGYADLAASPHGEWIYAFYEAGRVEGKWGVPSHLTFARFPVSWITGNR